MSEIPPPTVPPAVPPPPGGGSYTPPPPPPPGGSGYGGGSAPAGGGDRTLWIVLSYLGILSLIPYFTKKDDPDAEIRWHAKNGLGLFLVEMIIWVVYFVASIALRNTFLGCGLFAVNCVMWLAFVVISIICIVKALGGQRYRIPYITDFAEKSL